MIGDSERTIVLVEDSQNELDLTLRAFEMNRLRARVVVLRDGAEAVAYLADPARALPSVVLLDLSLPKLSGLEVLAQLRSRARTRALPVVLLTSSREDADIKTGYHQGANSFVRKPVDFDELVRVLGDLTAYWLSLNQLPPSR
jgi:two-component system response regulator